MKRDMELVKRILLKAEEHTKFPQPITITDNEFPQNEVNFHIQIMSEAGLIVIYKDSAHQGNFGFLVHHITWQGYDFLENSKNITAWEKAKGILASVGGFSFTIFSDILAQVVAAQINDSL